MARLSTTDPFTCVTCEAVITGPPTFHVGLPFCCAGCVANGPCSCSYDREPAVDTQLSSRGDLPAPVASGPAGAPVGRMLPPPWQRERRLRPLPARR